MVDLTFNAEQAAKIDALLGRFTLAPGRQTEALARGMAKALNRGALAARTAMVREVANVLGTAQKPVKGYIRTYTATPDHLVAIVTSLGKQGIPLGKLGPTGPEPSRGKGAGVRVKAAPGRFPHAFISTMRSGHRGVFERRGKARLPIKELRTRPVTDAFRERRAVGVARAAESLSVNLQSELAYALQRTA